MSDRKIIEEQIEYYERRAPEYDATATLEDDRLRRQEEELVAAVEAFRSQGRILELACGTGTWTNRLLRWSGRITAVDASASMLDLNQRQVGDARVEYVLADLFEWEPAGQFGAGKHFG